MKDEEFQKLLDAPGPVKLIQSKSGFKIAAIVSLLAAAWSAHFAQTQAADSSTTYVMAVIMVIAGGYFLWLGFSSGQYFLILDKTDFTVHDMGKQQHYFWNNASAFTTNSPLQDLIEDDDSVRFHYHLPNGRSETENLTANYGMRNANQLAQLLNHWRKRALAEK